MDSTNTSCDFGKIFSDLISSANQSSKPVVNISSSYSEDMDYKDEEIDFKRKYDELKEDFDQYRKRVNNTLETEKKRQKESLLIGFLHEFVSFMVNVYRGKTEHGTMAEEDYLILKKMNDYLDSMGIIPMENPVGKPFDTTTMDAVYSDRNSSYGDGIVSKVLENGFTMNGEVLLPQKVAVAV